MKGQVRSVKLNIGFGTRQSRAAKAAADAELQQRLAKLGPLMDKARRGDHEAISRLETEIRNVERDPSNLYEHLRAMHRAVEAGEQELRYRESLHSVRLWNDKAGEAKNTREAVLALGYCFDALASARYKEDFSHLRLESELGFTLDSVIAMYNDALEARYNELVGPASANLAALEALQALFVQCKKSRKQTTAITNIRYPRGWNTWVATQHSAPPRSYFDFSSLTKVPIEDVPVYVARAIEDRDAVTAMLWLRYCEGNSKRENAIKGLKDQLTKVAASAYTGRNRQQVQRTSPERTSGGNL